MGSGSKRAKVAARGLPVSRSSAAMASGVGKGSTLAEQQPASVSLGGGELVELARQG